MKLFSKIDKEILLILSILAVFLLLVGYTTYRYASGDYSLNSSNIENSIGGEQIEQIN